MGRIHINVAVQLPSQEIFEIELLTDSSQINLSLILDGLTKEEEEMFRWPKIFLKNQKSTSVTDLKIEILCDKKLN